VRGKVEERSIDRRKSDVHYSCAVAGTNESGVPLLELRTPLTAQPSAAIILRFECVRWQLGDTVNAVYVVRHIKA
jgi:hypothetical protein